MSTSFIQSSKTGVTVDSATTGISTKVSGGNETLTGRTSTSTT